MLDVRPAVAVRGRKVEAVAAGDELGLPIGKGVALRRPDEVTLTGTPVAQLSDQTATASRTSFSMGRPTELPHSLHDPS